MKVNANNASQAPAAMKAINGPAGPQSNKESVGDIANRVANAAGAANGRRVQGQGSPKLDKDAFFKLMLTHLKNQDPTSPLKSHEMASQLAQFSSLEQMSNIKEVLSEMNKGQASTGQYQSLDIIGKTVSGDSSRIDRMKGDAQHSVGFALNEPAATVQVAIKNAEGKVVKNFELQNQPKGTVRLDWDGKDIEGRSLDAGSYKVEVAAKSISGSKLAVDMKFKGQVTGIQFTEKGPIVFIGNKQIPLKEIKQVEIAEDKIANAQLPGMASAIGAPMANPMNGLMGATPRPGVPTSARNIDVEQMSGQQKAGLEQALSALKLGGASASPLSDPSQEILAAAVHNQNIKNN